MSRFFALPWRVDAHRRVQGLLSAYIDGWVSPEECSLLEDHLERCAPCRADLEGLRATAHLLRRIGAVPLPRRFTLTAAPSIRRQQVPAWPLPLASAAAGLLLVLVVAGDAAGTLPNGDLPTAPAAPAQERALEAGRPLAPFAGPAERQPSSPGAQGSPAPADGRATQAMKAPDVDPRPEEAPLPPGGPGPQAPRQTSPWRFVEAALGVITLALLALWAKQAMRGASS